MSIGAGVVLFVIGAILAFAVQDGISGIDLTVIGYICMGAGVIALVLAVAALSVLAMTLRLLGLWTPVPA